MEVNEVNLIVDKYKGKSWALISILQDIQERHGYLKRELIEQAAKRMNITLSRIYGIATFFKSLNLVPQGKHKITLCLGTACHVRGGAKILDEITGFLNITPDETTKDGFFTLKTVNCLGACAIGPVMVVDEKYYGHMSPSKAKKVLSNYRKKHNEKTEKHP